MFLVPTVMFLIYHHNITISRLWATHYDVPNYVVFFTFLLFIFYKLKKLFSITLSLWTLYIWRPRTHARTHTHTTGAGVVLCVLLMSLDRKEEYKKLWNELSKVFSEFKISYFANTIPIVIVTRKYLNCDKCEEVRSPAAVTVWVVVSLFCFRITYIAIVSKFGRISVLGIFRQRKTGIFLYLHARTKTTSLGHCSVHRETDGRFEKLYYFHFVIYCAVLFINMLSQNVQPWGKFIETGRKSSIFFSEHPFPF